MVNTEDTKISGIFSAISPVISLYPNPATEYFQIKGIEETALVTISDLNCRILYSTKITGNEKIPVSVLPKGVFIAKISTSGFTVEKKLIKDL